MNTNERVKLLEREMKKIRILPFCFSSFSSLFSSFFFFVSLNHKSDRGRKLVRDKKVTKYHYDWFHFNFFLTTSFMHFNHKVTREKEREREISERKERDEKMVSTYHLLKHSSWNK